MTTHSIEEIVGRCSKLQTKIDEELQPAFEKEMAEFKIINRQPGLLSYIFNTKRAQEYERKMQDVKNRYLNTPIIQELKSLRNECPHEFDSYKQRKDLPVEMARKCSICGLSEVRSIDYDDAVEYSSKRYFSSH